MLSFSESLVDRESLLRIAYIAAGAGSMYCGACHRDAALFRALVGSGHECLAIPLYTALRTDLPLVGRTSPLFMGGISLYLGQALALFRHLPASLQRQFDRPSLLRGISKFAVHTAPAKLGRLTEGVLAGLEGPHAGEIDRLIRFLREEFRPDIINLSNSLLAPLAAPMRAALRVPIVSTLQGEECFVEALPQPYRERSIQWLRRHALSIDRFICCAQERVPVMAAWLKMPEDRFAVIPTGMDPQPFAAAAQRVQGAGVPMVLGYLSSIRREKGLDLLVESLRQLVHTHQRDVRLAVAGQVLDRSYWREVRKRIRDAGLQGRVTYYGELDLAGKVQFLQACDLFIMPTRLPESRALAAMEALAAGVPVVAARLGVLPELLECTGGGLTVAPEDGSALAAGILHLLENNAQAGIYSKQGRVGIVRHYSPEAMAERTIAEYQSVLGRKGSAAGSGFSGTAIPAHPGASQ